MAKKRGADKKAKKGSTGKARRRNTRPPQPKPSLELTNYLLESHPEFDK